MSKTARADWAPPPTWDEIRNKPAIIGVPGPRGPAGPAGPQGPPGTAAGLPPQFTLTWDVPELLPLQTATQTFNVGGVLPGHPLALGWSPDPGFCWLWGLVTDTDVVTLYAKNMDAVPVTLGEMLCTVQRFN